jgi:hypothetical protein
MRLLTDLASYQRWIQGVTIQAHPNGQEASAATVSFPSIRASVECIGLPFFKNSEPAYEPR